MDEVHFELAQLLEEQQRERAIRAARDKQAKYNVRPAEYEGLCTQCDEPVPSARQAAGYYNCIDCARENELREKQIIRGVGYDQHSTDE